MMRKTIFLFGYLFMLLGAFFKVESAVTATPFALDATYKIDTVWATAYQATITLKNTTSSDTSSWTTTFSLPSGYSLSPNVPLQNVTISGQNITVKNSTANGIIKSQGSLSFPFLIIMPSGSPTVLNNLQSSANGGVIPPTSLAAPVLNAVQSTGAQNYTVSWNSVTNATSYILQQDTTTNFSNPIVVGQGNVVSKVFTNQANGTYFYRVAASNASGQSNFSNIQSITISQTTPPTLPKAPVLNAIQSTGTQNYTISWNSVTNATSYILQQATTSSFSNPTVVAQGNVVSKAFTNQANGTYFYRVAASNASGQSNFSNIQSITISQTIPPSSAGIEHAAWYIDWTSWFTGPPFVIPTGVNMLNVFVGTLMFDSNNNPTIGGFGNLTLPQLDAFTAYCAQQNPPIAVKVSIGGSGGMYDQCWNLLTVDNVNAFAQGMADFCHTHGVAGVDFDYESFVSAAQENLVGMLIKEFKTIDPKLQTSLCSNAGFGPNFPWQPVIQNILDAATISTNQSALDRFYIMSYYDPIDQEQSWILGWADWLKTNYGFTPDRISVGIDDFDAHAYDPVAFANWAASMGFSTAHWAFDPARPN
jgi:Cellulose binding domain/Glycosyl hydrolases family 18